MPMNQKIEIVVEDIDEGTVERARARARREGKTLDEMMEGFPRRLADEHEACSREQDPTGPTAAS
jgi:hypothetical protein